ncbi:hypothetical protein niasHS_015868 [Heterodera schachtii]|uniref:RING-type domain-containing protein n=1 Tax=Heterodera schachtii TaxID=97005 RepID=A0ABD2I172_HETSC
MAHRTFLIDQKASLIAKTSAALADPRVSMIEYELELICYLQTKNNPDGKLFYFIGSGIQLRTQKGIHVPLYDREVLNLCKKIAIDVIYNGTRRRINIQKENDFILNSIFKINIDTQTAYPAGHSNFKNSRPQLRIPERNFGSIGSLSLTSPASSTLTSELPSPNESNENAKTPSTNEQSNKNINCIECLKNIRDTVFLPCKHLGTCDSCAKKILDSTEKQCPGCGSQIKETLKINFL